MAGGFDYKNFKKMCNNVTKASKTIDQFLEDFLVGEALEALALTKERTPVDVGGDCLVNRDLATSLRRPG